MRQVRYGVAASLDGFVAGPNGEADWIIMDPEIDFDAIFSRFDALLMGRRTYETMAPSGDEFSFPSLPAFVFSDTLDPPSNPQVSVVRRRDSQRFVAELRRQEGKDLWLFGGGDLFRSLAAEGLVDGVDVAVTPVLLGAGVPLYAGVYSPLSLRLTSRREYSSGIVSLEYSVVGASSGALPT